MDVEGGSSVPVISTYVVWPLLVSDCCGSLRGATRRPGRGGTAIACHPTGLVIMMLRMAIEEPLSARLEVKEVITPIVYHNSAPKSCTW